MGNDITKPKNKDLIDVLNGIVYVWFKLDEQRIVIHCQIIGVLLCFQRLNILK